MINIDPNTEYFEVKMACNDSSKKGSYARRIAARIGR